MESHQAGYMMNPAYVYDEVGYASNRPHTSQTQYSYPASHDSNIYYTIQDERQTPLTFKSSNQRKRTIALICVLILVLVIIAVGVALGVILSEDKDDDKPSVQKVQLSFQGEGNLLGKTWSADYLDSNSQLYKTAEQEFKDKVNTQLSQSSLQQYYQDINVIGFREGSVFIQFLIRLLVPVVEATLVTANSISNEMILIPDVTSVNITAISATTSTATSTSTSTLTTTSATSTSTSTTTTSATTTAAPTTTTTTTPTTTTTITSTSSTTTKPANTTTAQVTTTTSTAKVPSTTTTTRPPTTTTTTKAPTTSTSTPAPTTTTITTTTTPTTAVTTTTTTPTTTVTTTTTTPRTTTTSQAPTTTNIPTTTTPTTAVTTTTTTPTTTVTTSTTTPSTTTTSQAPTTTPSFIPDCSEGFSLYTILIEYLSTYNPILLDIQSQPATDLKKYLENWGNSIIAGFGVEDTVPQFNVSDFGPPLTDATFTLVTIRVCIDSSANAEQITSLLGAYISIFPEYNNVGLSDVFDVVFEYVYTYDSAMSNVTSSAFSDVANTLQSKASDIINNPVYNLTSTITAYYVRRLEPMESNSNTKATMRMSAVYQSVTLDDLNYYLGLATMFDPDISVISVEQT